MLVSILLIGTIYAVEVSYCCEKTKTGVWCDNEPEDNCDDDYRKAPTSCEATSYCKLGCCYDGIEGTCMENTPQKVCENSNGVWEDEAQCDIPQCSLGCCLIGDQAAFVTQTRCKRLSSLYGLETNFRTDLNNEVQCILSATSGVKGACVFEKEYEKTCLFLTQKECNDMRLASEESNVEFHEGYLCSADALGTNCARPKEKGDKVKTTCVEGRDEVYFIDTCGNLANVYDDSKVFDAIYWAYIAGTKGGVEVDCGSAGSSNANSETCGNCDYYLGSTCKKAELGNSPTYGDYICEDLGCYEGNKKIADHGETWCAEAGGVSEIIIDNKGEIKVKGEDLPGGRYFRLVCYNGEVTVEPCADYRQEVCIQSEINGFKTAACRVNMWQDCYSQDDEDDCENTERRDCKWIGGDYIECVPRHAPGFDFWETDGGDAESLCSMATVTCEVKYEKKLGDDWKVKGDETCLDDDENIIPSWESDRNDMCIALGDCGSSVNYIGTQGYN